MAFYSDPEKLWLVRTVSGSHTHLAESKAKATKPNGRTLCGCAIRPAAEYAQATNEKQVDCDRCVKASKRVFLGNHGRMDFWMSGVHCQTEK